MNPSLSQQACVLGLGQSGHAAARLLLHEGWNVTVLDTRESEPLRHRALRLRDQGAEVYLEAKALPETSFDYAVVSPGLPVGHPWVRELQRRGVPVEGELELGARHCKGQLLAVTGSNGKSTLVKFLTDTLLHERKRAAAAGNYGLPLSEVALEEPELEWIVVEVSSFQLETINAFRPSAAILLNVYPNHLDRHGSMETYTRMKCRLFENMRPEDLAIVPHGLAGAVREQTGGRPTWLTFGTHDDATYRWDEGHVHGPDGQRVSFEESVLGRGVLGLHAAAAVAALDMAGVRRSMVERMGRAFIPLPHRMQELPSTGGIRFINDSKATNMRALRAAVEGAGEPVRLIAGGIAKEKDLAGPKEVLAHRARAVYLMGQAAGDLAEAWSDVVPCHGYETLEQAFFAALDDAVPGEVILLAPGCTSFDQFSGFEERGDAFMRLVDASRTEERL